MMLGRDTLSALLVSKRRKVPRTRDWLSSRKCMIPESHCGECSPTDTLDLGHLAVRTAASV